MRLIAMLVSLVAASAAQAQTVEAAFDAPVVIAHGEGSARRQADIYLVGGTMEGRGASQVEALEALVALQTRVQGALETMDINAIEVRTGDLGVVPTYPSMCDDEGRARTAQAVCDVTGYSATLQVVVRVQPAVRAGDVVSLMSELGVRYAGLEGARLSSRTELQREAAAHAFTAARAEAEVMAAASGGRLGRVLRVQDSRASYGRRDTDAIVVTGSRVTREGLVASAPTVSVEIAPPDIEEEVDVTVVFELLPNG